MRFKLISIGLLFGFSSLQSCKTSVRSSVKDVVGAPAGFGMTFEKIPAGTFMMGSPDSEAERRPNEGPQRLVT
jgi:formylglycine-generating enzyme required for sulfatase activity